MYGLNKLYLLMEKQHNRGQEGAGLACVKLEANPGEEYNVSRTGARFGTITEIFGTVQSNFKDLTKRTTARRRLCQARAPLCGGGVYGASALLHHGEVGPLVRASVSQAEQLACQEPCPVRQLQPDERG